MGYYSLGLGQMQDARSDISTKIQIFRVKNYFPKKNSADIIDLGYIWWDNLDYKV